jgi:photosystem II stability/assembly factor-like uncharacterized protein
MKISNFRYSKEKERVKISNFRYMNRVSFILLLAYLVSWALIVTCRPVSSQYPPKAFGNGGNNNLDVTRITPGSPTEKEARALYGRSSLSFEVNHGQSDAQVKFLARGQRHQLFLTATEAVLELGTDGSNRVGKEKKTSFSSLANPRSSSSSTAAGATLRMKLMGANPAPQIIGTDELLGKSHYLIGRDPKAWRTDLHTYAKVHYRDVYPGVDLVYHGDHQRQLEYNFTLAPGADPKVIDLAFEGTQEAQINIEDGDLALRLTDGVIRLRKPVVYQMADGIKREIASHYARKGERRVGFAVGKYDSSLPLMIDPVLAYSTYLGGNDFDLSNAIAVDRQKNIYVTGYTFSTNFPVENPLQPALNFRSDAFITKIDPDGNLIYSTYLGGHFTDVGIGVAVDLHGNAYVAGYTASSSDFPTTPDAFQSASRTGICGFDIFEMVEVPCTDAFVAKVDPSGSALVYSTYLSGEYREEVYGVSVDTTGSAYVVGGTESPNFPTENAWQPQITPGSCADFAICPDSFVAKLNSSGSALVYSTYLGGASHDIGEGIAVTPSGEAYALGSTVSADFPTTAGAFQREYNKGRACFPDNFYCRDAFVTKFDRKGRPIYSTYVGGGGSDEPLDIAVDQSGQAYIVGNSVSTDFPTVNPLQTKNGGASVSADGGENWRTINSGLPDTLSRIAVDPANPSTVYAGSLAHGVFKSTDNGRNWAPVGEEIARFGLCSMAVTPQPPSTLYVGACSGGVFKSVDGGGSWNPISNGLPPSSVYSIAIDPKNPSTLYLTTADTVFKTNDGGNNWQAISPNFGSLRNIVIDPINPSIIYVAGFGQIYKSVDGGNSWRSLKTGLPDGPINALAIDPKTPSTLYAGMAIFGGGNDLLEGVYKSIDGGESWTGFSAGLTQESVTCLVVDPQNPNTIYAGTTGAEGQRLGLGDAGSAKAPDSGARDSANKLVTLRRPILPNTVWPGMLQNNHMISGKDAAPLRPLIKGADASTNLTEISNQNPTQPAEGADGGIFKSIDGGVSWKAVNTGLSSNYVLDIAISPLSSQTLYAATFMNADGFVVKLNRAGSALIYSTFLGGRSTDEVNGVALDHSSNVYLVGSTVSTDFPLVDPLQPQMGTPLGMPLWADAFVMKLNAAGTEIIYSTYLGGADTDLGADIAVDSCGDPYVTGITYSINFPTAGGMQPVFGGGIDTFISRLGAHRGVCHK